MVAPPFAPSAARNADAILAALRTELEPDARVLEIGAGTGQHAVRFAAALPGTRWLPTERPDGLADLRVRTTAPDAPPGIEPPAALDVLTGPWPIGPFDACFGANVLHIMSLAAVEALFAGAAERLRDGGRPPVGGALCLYGPVSIGGRYTSEGNRAFDAALRTGDTDRGIRDLEALDALAARGGLARARLERLPANNHFMVWRARG